MALQAGELGLDCLEKIISKAPHYLLPSGYLLVEHGHDQKNAVQALFQKAGFGEINTVNDIADVPRVTIGRMA